MFSPRGTMKMKPRCSSELSSEMQCASRDPRHGPAVVLDADECTSKGIHRLSSQFPCPQSGAVDDGVDLELPRQRLGLGGERPVDLPLDDAAALLPNFAEQPLHINIRVDHGSEVRVRVLQTQLGVDAVLPRSVPDHDGTRRPRS